VENSGDLALPSVTVSALASQLIASGDMDGVRAALPVISRLGPDGAALAPKMREIADSPPGAPLRCKLLGTISAVAPDKVDWNDLFKDEIHREQDDGKGFATCAGEIAPAVAQPVLEALLKDAPLRNRAAVFERIASLSKINGTDSLS